ncbi:hypothetical protein D3C85_1313580 [compost metagenome]
MIQPRGEGVDGQTRRRDRRAVLGPADGGGDLDRGHPLGPGFRQLRIGAEARAFRQAAFGSAGGEGDQQGQGGDSEETGTGHGRTLRLDDLRNACTIP